MLLNIFFTKLFAADDLTRKTAVNFLYHQPQQPAAKNGI